MIIKTGGISAGDGPRVTAYAVRLGDNERVDVLQDENYQLLISDEFAETKGRKNGLLHIIISPDQELVPDELDRTLEAIREEFSFSKKDPETLTRHQSRRTDGRVLDHYHLVRPAADSETGRTYKLFRSKAKDEAISRRMELELGHQLTSGLRNDFSELRLREMGKDQLADRLAAELGDEEKPSAAYSHNDHQQAKRQGFDLPALRQTLKELTELPRDQQPQALAEMIHSNGLGLQAAVTEGRGRSRINIELPSDLRAHNANRTLKIRAAQVVQFIEETQEKLHEIRSGTPETRPDSSARSAIADYSGSGADSRVEPSYDSAYERVAEDHSSHQQELKEADELAAAAETLQSQAKNFASNRVGDFNTADLEPNPDIDDPNLLLKLARILRNQMRRANEAAKAAIARSKPPATGATTGQ